VGSSDYKNYFKKKMKSFSFGIGFSFTCMHCNLHYDFLIFNKKNKINNLFVCLIVFIVKIIVITG